MTLEKGRHDLIYGLQTVEPAEILELCKNRLLRKLSFLLIRILSSWHKIIPKIKTIPEVIFMSTVLLFE